MAQRHVSVALLPLLLSAFAAQAAGDPPSTPKEGTTTTEIRSITGLQKNGSADPSKDAACRDKFGKLLGKKAVSRYTINPATQIMKAQTTFENQVYEQSPLGIYGKWVFGAYFNPSRAPLGVYGAIYSLSYQFDNPINNFVLTLDDSTNCLASSAPKPLEEPERVRFGGSAS
ncbi:hypothetical protein [Roseateles sp. L2-2]|uniref:hypothetical protein n=1 Tax=Roseateles TaxID=93681 RepID=UPI003D36E60D